MWLLMVSIAMLCSVKLAQTIKGLPLLAIAPVLHLMLLVAYLIIRSEREKFKPQDASQIKENESTELERLKKESETRHRKAFLGEIHQAEGKAHLAKAQSALDKGMMMTNPTFAPKPKLTADDSDGDHDGFTETTAL